MAVTNPPDLDPDTAADLAPDEVRSVELVVRYKLDGGDDDLDCDEWAHRIRLGGLAVEAVTVASPATVVRVCRS